VMERIVDRSVAELQSLLEARGVRLTVDPAAREWLAGHALDGESGARPLARLMDERLRRPIGDEILFGALRDGGRVEVGADGSGLVIDFTDAAP
jgi:ATP-dependent Clp protease ATP-binding subunit ClpA